MEITQHFYKSSPIYKAPEHTLFYDVRRDGRFAVHGLYDYKTEKTFKRMPTEVAERVNPRVAHLHLNTAGGRVRFRTNSQRLTVKATYPLLTPRSILTEQASMGFDIYLFQNGAYTFHAAPYPPVDMTEAGYEKCTSLGEGEHEVEIYLPLYNGLDSLLIGLDQGASLEAPIPYTDRAPVLYYGSSITQGASASRPGNAYSAMLERRFHTDFINLGFASGGCGENAIAEYMASLSFSAFVCDYDYNAPTEEHLEKTHLPLYRTLRAAHPEAPILLITKPILLDASDNEENAHRREIIYATYRRALAEGDRHIYLIDGKEIFAPYRGGVCCADGVHPNDLGMWVYAESIAKILKNDLGWKEFGK